MTLSQNTPVAEEALCATLPPEPSMVQSVRIEEQHRLLERQKILTGTIERIRESLDLGTIFNTTVREVRQLFQCDRAVIYRFSPDWSGEFVAEDHGRQWLSLLHAQAEDEGFKDPISECSAKLLAPFIQRMTLPETALTDTYLKKTGGGAFCAGEIFRLTADIYQSGFTPCYIKVLESYQARAYAIVAIYHDQKLWGLLAVYQNDAPRIWQADEIAMLIQVGTQMGMALQQAEYVQQAHIQSAKLQKAAKRQRALSKTIDRIRQSLDINDIFTTTTQEVRLLLEVDRVAIYRFNGDWSGDFVADSIGDSCTLMQPSGPITPSKFALVKNADGNYPRHETFVPILQGEKLWGLLMAYQSNEPHYWQEGDVNLLAQVGTQLGVAIQQAELLEHSQNQAQQLQSALAELKASQAQLIQREKMASLGHLVAGVAHEINNPAGFIAGNLQYIDEYGQGLLALVRRYQAEYSTPSEEIRSMEQDLDLDFMGEDLPRVLSSMRAGSDRIRQIVLSLRNFARHDESEIKTVDLHEGLDNTLLILQHYINNVGRNGAIDIVKQYGNLPLVECHPAQMNQVFMNILTNAIDAIEDRLQKQPYQPQLQIYTECIDSNIVRVQIRDNGLGMDEAVRSHIFDPFFTTKPIGKGTGLGLSITYQIITEHHHGKLLCESEPGSGTVLTLEIPTTIQV